VQPYRLLQAFNEACACGDLELAGVLLQNCEAAMELPARPDADRRFCEELLISAFEHLWFLRHAVRSA
jgi:hypothetical protein